MESDKKSTAYETLIRISLQGERWSAKHLAIEHAYIYYLDLCRRGKLETAAKQFIILKIYIVQALGRLRKKTRSEAKKQNWSDLWLLLELVDGIAELDRVIMQALVLAGRVTQIR